MSRIAGVARLLVGRNGVDVLGCRRVGNVYAFLAPGFNQFFDQEMGPFGAFLSDDAGQSVQPFFGFLGVGVSQDDLRVRGHGFVSS